MNGPVNDSDDSRKAQLEASTGCMSGGSFRMASWVCRGEMSSLGPNYIRGITQVIEMLHEFQLTLLTRNTSCHGPHIEYTKHVPDFLSKAL